MYVYAPRTCLMPEEDRRWYWILWNWNCRRLQMNYHVGAGNWTPAYWWKSSQCSRTTGASLPARCFPWETWSVLSSPVILIGCLSCRDQHLPKSSHQFSLCQQPEWSIPFLQDAQKPETRWCQRIFFCLEMWLFCAVLYVLATLKSRAGHYWIQE